MQDESAARPGSEGGQHPNTARPSLGPDGRYETLNMKMDRNWNEMLQELRVTQTGTQILTGFLLTIAFQPTFADLDEFQRTSTWCWWRRRD